MVAATLVLLCTKPLESSLLNDGTWLLTVPSIAIIGREVVTQLICISTSKVFSEFICSLYFFVLVRNHKSGRFRVLFRLMLIHVYVSLSA
jgi:hypothetical protein